LPPVGEPAVSFISVMLQVNFMSSFAQPLFRVFVLQRFFSANCRSGVDGFSYSFLESP
jgi:hypothetical protein